MVEHTHKIYNMFLNVCMIDPPVIKHGVMEDTLFSSVIFPALSTSIEKSLKEDNLHISSV